jgi:hypothetical protein
MPALCVAVYDYEKMPCTRPKKCWPHGITKNGKQNYVFKKPENYQGEHQEVPCNTCVSCLLDRSKEWATRAVHEAQMHPLNCFITLTYRNEDLPENGSLDIEDHKKFIKRLKKHLAWRVTCIGDKYTRGKNKGKSRYKDLTYRPIKYLMSGEYGSEQNTFRPHLHYCIFGWEPTDKKFFKYNKRGDPIYISETLAKIWNKGYVTVEELNYNTAAYVARYTLKKVKDYDTPNISNEIIDRETGETNYDPRIWRLKQVMEGKLPEFIRMSKGLGKSWYARYKSDTYKDYVTTGKLIQKIPRYYDKQLEKEDPKRLEAIKEKRKKAAIEIKSKDRPSDQSRDSVKRIKLKLLTRSI